MTEIPAGWYPDPAPETLPGRQRYWDGTAWTQHVHDPQPAPAYPSAYPGGHAPAYPASFQPSVRQVPTTPDGERLSGWWRRVLAVLLDGLFLSPVYVGVFAVFLIPRWDEIRRWFDDYRAAVEAGRTVPSPPDVLQPSSGTMLGILAVYSVFVAVYTLGFWRWKQATPGKMIVGVRIRRRETPGPMPWSTMVVRFLFVQVIAVCVYVPYAGLLFVLAGLLDYLWPLWDSRNQALHDKVARTNVVRSRQARPPGIRSQPPGGHAGPPGGEAQPPGAEPAETPTAGALPRRW